MSSTPETVQNGSFAISDRTSKLIELFDGHTTVRVFRSKVTLEYDLAEAGHPNAALMAKAWESCFPGTPQTLNRTNLAGVGSNEAQRALHVWRGICCSATTGSKAEFAQLLAERLSRRRRAGPFAYAFEIPPYLKHAIKYVVDGVTPQATTTAETGT